MPDDKGCAAQSGVDHLAVNVVLCATLGTSGEQRVSAAPARTSVRHSEVIPTENWKWVSRFVVVMVTKKDLTACNGHEAARSSSHSLSYHCSSDLQVHLTSDYPELILAHSSVEGTWTTTDYTSQVTFKEYFRGALQGTFNSVDTETMDARTCSGSTSGKFIFSNTSVPDSYITITITTNCKVSSPACNTNTYGDICTGPFSQAGYVAIQIDSLCTKFSVSGTNYTLLGTSSTGTSTTGSTGISFSTGSSSESSTSISTSTTRDSNVSAGATTTSATASGSSSASSAALLHLALLTAPYLLNFLFH